MEVTEIYDNNWSWSIGPSMIILEILNKNIIILPDGDIGIVNDSMSCSECLVSSDKCGLFVCKSFGIRSLNMSLDNLSLLASSYLSKMNDRIVIIR